MPVKDWGLRPVLFYAWGFPVESYAVFVFLALITAISIYLLQLRKEEVRNGNALYIAIFAILGGTIGSKLPIMVAYWKEINADPNSFALLLSGRTIVGGLLGGWIGSFTAKKIFNIKERMGNQIAIPAAIGMAIGRLGCVFRGCCYGEATGLSLGIDFGDHVLRHPTQIYEMIFDLGLALYLYIRKKKGVKPGELFRIFLNGYLSFRFLIEFIRVEKIALMGLTDFQLLCIISLLFINRKQIISILKFNKRDVKSA